jgi:hypothetical protein
MGEEAPPVGKDKPRPPPGKGPTVAGGDGHAEGFHHPHHHQNWKGRVCRDPIHEGEGKGKEK